MSKPALVSILVTLFIHGSLAGGVAAFSAWDDGDDEEDTTRKIMTIEAALAYKSDKPADQPQKQRKRKKKRKKTRKQPKPAAKVAPGTPDKQSEPEDAPDPADEEDFAAQFDKFRDQRQNEDEEDDSDWTEESDTDVEPAGTFDGSKHGFAEVSRGDPYMQQLAADVYTGWELTTLEKSEGAAVGCVRLAADGTVMAAELWKPTENANIDLSVKHALAALEKKRAAKPTPVPAHLMDATTQWTCFKFSVDKQ